MCGRSQPPWAPALESLGPCCRSFSSSSSPDPGVCVHPSTCAPLSKHWPPALRSRAKEGGALPPHSRLPGLGWRSLCLQSWGEWPHMPACPYQQEEAPAGHTRCPADPGEWASPRLRAQGWHPPPSLLSSSIRSAWETSGCLLPASSQGHLPVWAEGC